MGENQDDGRSPTDVDNVVFASRVGSRFPTFNKQDGLEGLVQRKGVDYWLFDGSSRMNSAPASTRRLGTLPGILKVLPISGNSDIIAIIGRIDHADQPRNTVNQLQSLLYAA